MEEGDRKVSLMDDRTRLTYRCMCVYKGMKQEEGEVSKSLFDFFNPDKTNQQIYNAHGWCSGSQRQVDRVARSASSK